MRSRRVRDHLFIRELLCGLSLAVLIGVTVWGMRYAYPAKLGPEQPLPFSHRVHTQVKQIGCFVCHQSAPTEGSAGIPPLQTCMLCHEHIIIHFPPIETLREHYATGQPVLWNRVYELPDFVYFNHSRHLDRSIDCSHCHGDVTSMDRVVRQQTFTMGYCVQCHRDHKVSHDCYVCHR